MFKDLLIMGATVVGGIVAWRLVIGLIDLHLEKEYQKLIRSRKGRWVRVDPLDSSRHGSFH